MSRTSDTVSTTLSLSKAEPPQPCPGPLGYSRFPFSDAFLSLFFIRPFADLVIFLFTGACALCVPPVYIIPSINKRITYVAPPSFIPTSSFRHNVTFMYGVLASFTLSILSAYHKYRDPCGCCAYFLLPPNASAIIFIRSSALCSPSSFSSST